jgi:hypothetical protein
MRQAGDSPAQQLSLTRDLNNLGISHLTKSLPPTRCGLTATNKARQPVEASTRNTKANDRYDQSNY